MPEDKKKPDGSYIIKNLKKLLSGEAFDEVLPPEKRKRPKPKKKKVDKQKRFWDR